MVSTLLSERDSRRLIIPDVENCRFLSGEPPMAEVRWRRRLEFGVDDVVRSEADRGRTKEGVAEIVLPSSPRKVGLLDFCSMIVVSGVPWP